MPTLRQRIAFLRKTGLFLLFTLVVLWAALPYWSMWLPLRKPVHELLKQYGGGSASYESISLTHTGRVHINNFHFNLPWQHQRITVDIESAAARLLFSPQLKLRGIHAAVDQVSLLHIHSMQINAENWKEAPRIAIVSRDAELDINAWLANPLPFPASSDSEWPFSITANVQRVSLQGIPDYPELIVNATGSLGTENAFGAYVSIPGQKAAFSLAGVLDEQMKGLSELQCRINSFPVHATHTMAFQSIADGTLHLRQENNGGYASTMHVSLSDTSLRFSGDKIACPTLAVQTKLNMNPDFLPMAMDGTGSHAPIAYHHNAQVWNLPAGQATVHNSSTETTYQGRWEFPSMGALDGVIALQEKGVDGEIAFTLHDQSLHALLALLPESLRLGFEQVQSNLNAHGTLGIKQSELADIHINYQINDFNYVSGPIRVSNATLTGEGNGNVHGIVSVNQGAVTLDYAISQNQSLSIPVDDIKLDILWDNIKNQTQVSLAAAEAKPLADIAGKWDSLTSRWQVEGRLDLDNLASVWNTGTPESLHGLEGVGSVSLAAHGDATSGRFSAQSPDLTLYNFTVEPAYGLQIRNVSSAVTWNTASGSLAGRIESSTPYLSYAGNDVEWASDTLTVDITREGSDSPFHLSVTPPGGGIMNTVWDKQAGTDFSLSKLNLQVFVLPLVLDLLAGIKTREAGWLAEGSLDGNATMNNGELYGMIQLYETGFATLHKPSIIVENASMTLPFAYPLLFERFPSREFRFTARNVSLEDSDFQSPTFSIPISRDAITIASNTQLPIFGGILNIKQLQIEDWQEPQPHMTGAFELERLDVAKLHILFPFLPEQGALSGTIEAFTVSHDRIELNGRLQIDVFGGTMMVQDVFVRNPFTNTRVIGADIELQKIDLRQLTRYFDFGSMEGHISGTMDNLRFMLQPSSADSPILPIAFTVEIHSDMEDDGSLNKDALEKIVDLGQTSGLAKSMINRERYFFSALGLKAQLNGDNLILYGTQENNYFLAPSKKFFGNKIAISLGNPKQVISFSAFWKRLLDQIGRFKDGGGLPNIQVN
jgi:hypothetical protein